MVDLYYEYVITNIYRDTMRRNISASILHPVAVYGSFALFLFILRHLS